MLAVIGRIFDRVTAITAMLLRLSLVAALMTMLACIVLQVVMRYIVGRALSWSEELALLMFAWATLGGLALGVREGFHVRLDLLIGTLQPAARTRAERAINLATAAFGAYLAWSGVRFFEITGGSVSAAIAYPIELLHGLAPATGALIFLFALQRALRGAPDVRTDQVQDRAP
jgi:TRAP-type C4-dicarboxylate transport system permease small subunit